MSGAPQAAHARTSSLEGICSPVSMRDTVDVGHRSAHPPQRNPGIGKSSLARRYLDDHPLTLLLDIDAIRTALGRWREHPESKLIARHLALAMAEAHLRRGHDVVVPQYLGRLRFIVALENVAQQSDARFIEVLLHAGQMVSVERFRSRRNDLLLLGEGHPQADVSDSAVDSTVAEAHRNLMAVLSQRPNVLRVQADASLDTTYVDLLAALDTATP